ncbi:MAG: hypothetical protein E7242_04065 [Lachnospiraceae bacterium]|nr:hypothetical protein [Lachnospiraceae bacterium]
MVKTQAEKVILICYLIVEAILLVIIKALQIVDYNVRIIDNWMYTAIIVNTIITIIFFVKYAKHLENKHDNIIAYGLFLTLIADLFLTFIDQGNGSVCNFIGIACFCLVEFTYALYLKPGKITIILRIALFAAALIALYKVGMFDAGSIVGILNLILILFNVINAWTTKKVKVSLLFKIGITLFLGCDYAILFRGLTSGMVHDVADFVVWIFYIPAQVLIVLSYVKACKSANANQI